MIDQPSGQFSSDNLGKPCMKQKIDNFPSNTNVLSSNMEHWSWHIFGNRLHFVLGQLVVSRACEIPISVFGEHVGVNYRRKYQRPTVAVVVRQKEGLRKSPKSMGIGVFPSS